MATDAARRQFAEAIGQAARIADRRVIDAFARVHREAFLGPGPWTVRGAGIPAAQVTATADPSEVLRDVSVALDATRELYNGAPSVIAPWLDALRVSPGDRVVHIGAGTGYYSALLADLTGPDGAVDAVEIDPTLAARARANLAPWPWVRVTGDASSALAKGRVDVLLIHAGATDLRDEWLDALSPRGRMVVPLTCSLPGMPSTLGKGLTLHITRDDARWPVKVLGVAAIYGLEGWRDADRERALAQALMRGDWQTIAAVRRDAHASTGTCWLHGSACLTR